MKAYSAICRTICCSNFIVTSMWLEAAEAALWVFFSETVHWTKPCFVVGLNDGSLFKVLDIPGHPSNNIVFEVNCQLGVR